MLFAWLRICPNDALPKAVLAGAAHWTVSNRFSTSIRACAYVPPPVLTRLLTDRSTLFRHGESTPGSMRGALPNWLEGVAENAFLLMDGWSATVGLMRSVTLRSPK